MTKAEIVTETAKQTGIEKATALIVVEQSMAAVKDSLANGENVYPCGFGSFIVKQRAVKTARNISKTTLSSFRLITSCTSSRRMRPRI